MHPLDDQPARHLNADDYDTPSWSEIAYWTFLWIVSGVIVDLLATFS